MGRPSVEPVDLCNPVGDKGLPARARPGWPRRRARRHLARLPPPPNRRRRVPSSTRCDLGMPRPFECGHIMVPVRRGHPALGKTKVAFAIRHRRDLRQPSLGTIFAMDGGPGLRLDREALRQLADRRARADPAPPRPRPLRHARHRPLRRDRLPGPAGGPDPGIDRDRRVRQPARPELRRLHLGRSRRRHDQVRRALGLGKIFFYGDSYGTFFGQAYAVRHPGTLRGLILDSAYPGNDPYYRTLLPAGLHGLRLACRYSPTLRRRPGGAPDPRRPRLPRGRPLDREPDRLPARGGDAGAALLPQPRRRRPPLPRRRTAPPRPAARARNPAAKSSPNTATAWRSRSNATTTARSGTKRAVLAADRRTLGVGAGSSRATSPRLSAARSTCSRPAARLTPCLYWPAPPGGRPAAGDPERLARAAQLPDPGHLGPGRRRDLGPRGARGGGALPALKPLRRPRPRPRLSLYFPFRSPEVGVIRHFIASH